jgi:dephospho-CoA kinase
LGNVTLWGPEAEGLLIACLTGGIASGKSEVSGEFKRLDACVIDADVLAREVVEPGRPAYLKIVEEFGEGVLADSGDLDRKALAEVVFTDRAKLDRLNAITHPAIFKAIADGIHDYARSMKSGDVPAVIVDAALIVDVGAAEVFDMIIVVIAAAEERVRRMVQLRGMDEAESRARIASQVPDEERVEHAQLVIVNDGTIEELKAKVGEAWERIKAEAFSR